MMNEQDKSIVAHNIFYLEKEAEAIELDVLHKIWEENLKEQ